MPKVRKVQRRKKYRTNVNRKKLRHKLKKLPTIPCEQIKQAWDIKQSVRTNLNQMGLAYDPNEVLKIPSSKRLQINKVNLMLSGKEIESSVNEIVKTKTHIVDELITEATLPTQRMFKLPKNEVTFLTYLLNKYGEDYEAMTRDKKNNYQLTWKQLRSKIKKFQTIPEQYNLYLENKQSN